MWEPLDRVRERAHVPVPYGPPLRKSLPGPLETALTARSSNQTGPTQAEQARMI